MTAEFSVAFPRTSKIIHEGISLRWHLGMQLYVSQGGQPLADVAIGQNYEGDPLRTDHLMLWMSSGKPLTAAAILQLVDQGELSLNQPVRDWIPEFAGGSKGSVTVKHILTHTVGLRPINSGWPHLEWGEILNTISAAPIREGWQLGLKAGYDPNRTWFVLGEILRRAYSLPVDQVLREQVLEPLRMRQSWLAIPEHLQAPYRDQIGVMHELKDGELLPTKGHEDQILSRPSPGSSMRGPAREMGLFYEMLLREGKLPDGTSFLSPETVLQMTARQREGIFDQTFQHTLDFGLGLIINSRRYGQETVPYGFGDSAGENAFGHGGAQSSIGFADPEHQLVVVAIANGCPGEPAHQQRNRRINNAIYEDLGIA
ncbi:MAG: beta-lactamase family protein [Planctomycetaceae bacterium]|nr:beta-lactamase family protein [Planctomycetaceae bacterium]